jgi:hypothetical protein
LAKYGGVHLAEAEVGGSLSEAGSGKKKVRPYLKNKLKAKGLRRRGCLASMRP